MATLEKIKPGDVLYDVHSERAGNTTMRRTGIWKVRVIQVHADHALASWNGNPPRKYFRHDLKRLRLSEPKKMNGHLKGCGGYYGDWVADCTCAVVNPEAVKRDRGGR